MTQRARIWFAIGGAVLVAALVIGYRSTRRTAERRFANLSACLLGDPLADGETPAERARAIEYARPFQKMKVDESGVRPRLVPEKPLSPQEKWPTRCSPEARAFSRSIALRWLARRAVDRTLALVDDLEADRPPSLLDELWREARPVLNPAVAADAGVMRPWAAVKLLGQEHLSDLTPSCATYSLNASVDPWESDSFVLDGKPGCTIRSRPDSQPLASLTLGKAPIERKNRDKLDGVWDAHVLGRHLKMENGLARIWALNDSPPVELGAADSFSTCNGGRSRAVLLQSHAPEAFDLRFVDEREVSEPARVELAKPDFPGHGETEISHGQLTMNCREREARISWAWSTAVDQVHQHAIVIATCRPGHCDLREVRASIPMIWSLGCGTCDLDVTAHSVTSPRVIDLFDAVALIWSTRGTERARIAPLDRLTDARDIVLWEKPEKSYDDSESVRARGSVALVGVAVSEPREAHLFRLDAHGASALSPE